MTWPVTIDGTTYAESDFSPYGYLTNIPALALSIVNQSTKALNTTSTTSLAIGTGSKAFTMASEVPFAVGAYVVISETADPTTNNMYGQVTAVSGTSLTVNVTETNGSGTIAAWTISIAGPVGPAGVIDINGATAETATAATDAVIFYDASSAANRKITLANLLALFHGNTNVQDYVMSRATLKDYAETVVTANSGTSYTADLENGNVVDLTLTGNCTLTISNPPASGTLGALTLILTQDGTGSRTLTFPAAVIWAGGSAPTITATATTGTDVITLLTVDGGTTWYGFVAGQDFS